MDRTDAATYGPSYAAATFAFGVAQVSSPQIGGFIADWRGSFTLVFVMSAVVMRQRWALFGVGITQAAAERLTVARFAERSFYPLDGHGAHRHRQPTLEDSPCRDRDIVETKHGLHKRRRRRRNPSTAIVHDPSGLIVGGIAGAVQQQAG